MTRGLLDVNVLLALFDTRHVDHARSHLWMQSQGEDGWASCAVTQNGFIRIVSQPRYPNPVTAAQAMARLARATADPHHQFLTSSISVLDHSLVDPSRVLSSRQVTDVYLLALAVANNCRLVTLDRTIAVEAVVGFSSRDLSVIA